MDIGTVINALTWTIILILIIGTMLYVYAKKKWNKTVLIHKRVNNVSFAFFDKAQAFIDKDSQERWRLKKEKVTIDVPPNDAIRVLPNGTTFAECEKVSDMEYLWWKIDKVVMESKLKEARFVPIPQGVKTGFFNQYKKVIDRLNNNLWSKLATYAPYILLIIVAVLGMLMYNSIKDHNISIAKSNEAIASDIAKVSSNLDNLMTRYADLIEGKQTIKNDKDYGFNTTSIPR